MMSVKNLLNTNIKFTYYLFLVLMSLFLNLSAAIAGNGKVPLSWYALPEDYPDKIMDEFDWEDPDDDLKDEVDDIYEAQGDSYDELLRGYLESSAIPLSMRFKHSRIFAI